MNNPKSNYRYTIRETPDRLWTWHTQSMGPYAPVSNFNIGNFDIANIPLVSPADEAVASLPQEFRWLTRSTGSTDRYELNIYDPEDGEPWFFSDQILYPGDTYTLGGLPDGFSTGVLYGWEVWVYSPDGGYGVSYELRSVTISGINVSGSHPQSVSFKQKIRMLDFIMK